MASPRKKYQDRVESSDGDGPPVATAPQEAAAKPPEPVADADKQPVEMPATSDAVRDAEKVALRQRLAEMDRASTIVQHAMTERPRMATEPQRAQQEVPGPVKAWLAEHPEYLSDVVGQAELQLATLKSLRGGRTWNDDDFIDVLERHLGLNGHTETSTPPAEPAPRNTTQQRSVIQRQGAPVSAPPTREALSMSTGRPTNEPTRLTVEEVQLARSLGISEDEYKAQKAKMNRLKAAGAIQSGQQ